MKKFITGERTGLHYELVGDYYLIAGEDEPEEDQPIRVGAFFGCFSRLLTWGK